MAQPNHYTQHRLPVDATPFKSNNTTDITSTTEVSIKAATSGKAIFLKGFAATNKNASEVPMITLQEITGDAMLPSGVFFLGGKETLVVEFDEPVQLTTGEGIEGKSDASTGDTVVTVWGWVGTPAS